MLAQMPGQAAREVLSQCVTAMAELDAGLRFVWLNPALAELLGAGMQRSLGMTLDELSPGSPYIVAAAQRAFGEQQVVLLRQARICGAHEQERIVDIALSPLGNERLLLEIHTSVANVEVGSPALSESLRGFAHEVKNPLAGVRGAAQLISRRVDTAELRELAELIIDESDRLAALADRLLRAGGKPRLARLNVHELLERVALLIAAEEGAAQIRRDYDPSLPAVLGDRDRLHQLLLNLVRNAVEAGARSVTLRSRLEYAARIHDRLHRHVLRIDVIDDGCGVPSAIATSLYQPLVSGRAQGTGLGLALAREIAHEHAAELRHSSRAGATTFSLLLPLDATS